MCTSSSSKAAGIAASTSLVMKTLKGWKITVVQKLFQIIRIASKLQDESRAPDLLWDSLVEQFDVLINFGDNSFFIQLQRKTKREKSQNSVIQ